MLEITDLKRRFLNLMKQDGINEIQLEEIEKTLNIVLPKDFKEIASFFSGGSFGIIDNYNFAKTCEGGNIADETLRLREAINLPANFIVLSEPPESLIVMDLKEKPSIIWCDANDASNLEHKSFCNEPNVWEDYSEYFNELLSDEEEDKLS